MPTKKPALATAPAPQGSRGRKRAPRVYGMSRRDIRLLRALRAGLDTGEIAKLFKSPPNSIRNQISAICQTLGVAGRAEAIVYAIRRGILDPLDGSPEPFVELSERERRLLALMSRSASTEDMAQALGLAPKTIRNCQYLLYRKLGVHNCVDAVLRAVEWGVLPPVKPLACVFDASTELVVRADGWNGELTIRHTALGKEIVALTVKSEEIDSLITALEEAQEWVRTVEAPSRDSEGV